MDISNPKEITYIKEIDGETIRPEALNDTELAALTAETEGIGWKKDSDGKYYLPSGLADVNGTVIRIKCIPIGDWDMAEDSNVIIDTGIPYQQWRGATVYIFQDEGGALGYHSDFGLHELGPNVIRITQGIHPNDNYMQLERKDGSPWDSANYEDEGFNRGYVLLFYEPA